MALRFVAGETLDDAVRAIDETNRDGMSCTLDHLGENITTEAEAAKGADSYVAALEEIAKTNLKSNVSCKPTHMGLDLSPTVAHSMLERVVATGATHGIFVRIDMESSRYTDVTLRLTRDLFAQYGNVGTVLQSSLYRSKDDLTDLNRESIRVRLVKGAYLEPPTVAFPRKDDVDANYRRLADLLLSAGSYPAFATHDEHMLTFVRERAQSLGRPATEFEFQMLYGIRRDLQRQLHADGYRVRLYIPYGTQWYPYLMRRLAERPANIISIAGHVATETIHRPRNTALSAGRQ